MRNVRLRPWSADYISLTVQHVACKTPRLPHTVWLPEDECTRFTVTGKTSSGKSFRDSGSVES
jgi:hypothetical protein